MIISPVVIVAVGEGGNADTGDMVGTGPALPVDRVEEGRRKEADAVVNMAGVSVIHNVCSSVEWCNNFR